MKTKTVVVAALVHALHARLVKRHSVLSLLLLLCGHHAAFAQPNRFATNLVVPIHPPPISVLRKTAIFDPKTVRALTASIGAAGSFTVYSVDTKLRISTNVFTAASTKELDDAKTKIHIIPFEPTAMVFTNSASRTKRIVLPMKVGVAVETGGPNNETVLRFGEIFLEALETPLRWNTNSGSYMTTLAVGLDFPGHPEITKLPVPVIFTLITRNAVVNRNTVSVRNPGPPYEQVQLIVSNARAEATVTAHYPLVKDEALPLDCALELDKIAVDVTERQIAAFGLGTTRLTVRRIAKDQSEITDATKLELVLSLDSGKGHLESGVLIIPPNASKAETELRSVGLGTAEILASAGGVTGKSGIVTYFFPIGLMAATLLGGLLGGVGRYFRQRKSKATKASIVKWIIQGIVCGVLIVAAALAGIIIFALPSLVLATELGVFVTAALAGYAGAPILDKVVKRFGK